MNVVSTKIAAVIVAFNRDNLLERSLQYTVRQTRKPDLVIVVDNANLESTRLLVESQGAVYLNGAIENGSAGGFAIGLDYALSVNCDFVWTLDDDGYPDLNCLSTLLEFTLGSALNVSSPLSLSQEDHTQTANPYLIGLSFVRSARDIIELIGYPKKELFLRGDEMDYYYRARRAKAKMGLVTKAIFYHPSGVPDFANSRNSVFGVVIPKQPNKLFYQFRNRGYLIREYSLIINAIYDWIRYPLFFLVYPGRNLQGFMQWKRLWLQGFNRDLRPYTAE